MTWPAGWRIRELLAAGLSTAAIAELGTCVRDAPPTPACSGALQRLPDEHVRIDRLISRLRAAQATLDAVIERGDRRPPSSQAAPQAAGRY